MRRQTLLSLVIVLVGCGRGAEREAFIAMTLLEDRRSACDEQGAMVHEAWSDASAGTAGYMIEEALASERGVTLQARSETRGGQVAKYLMEISSQKASDRRTALLDLATEVDALCSITGKPYGLNLLSFSERRGVQRTAIDRALSKAKYLVPQIEIAEELAVLDAEVASAVKDAVNARAIRMAKEAAEEEVRRLEEQRAAAREASAREAAAQAERERQREIERDRAEATERQREAMRAAREREEAARRETLRKDCRASQAWRKQYGPVLVSVSESIERATCEELKTEPDAILKTNPPAGVDRIARDLVALLREAERRCRATGTKEIGALSLRARGDQLAKSFLKMEGECAALGL